jgi:hypothetical protein
MADKCLNIEKNKRDCKCTYEPCARKGFCCECLRYHLRLKEVPACFFTPAGEATFDRSLENFIRCHRP